MAATTLTLLFTAAALPLLAATAGAQRTGRISAGAGYLYDRTSVLPNCTCVNLNGGHLEFQYALRPHVGLVADVSLAHQGGITPDGYTLTQTVYTGGLRFWPNHPGARLRPFAEVLGGAAHAGGSLSPARTGSGGANAAAFRAGGGLDVRLRDHLTLVPIQAGYLLTRFGNSASNQQNGLVLSSGLRFTFGH